MKKILIAYILFICIGCVSHHNKGFSKGLPRWVQVLDESRVPIEGVVLGTEAPVPFVNKKTDKYGRVKVTQKSLFKNGNVLLSKEGYHAYYKSIENMPDEVILRSR